MTKREKMFHAGWMFVIGVFGMFPYFLPNGPMTLHEYPPLVGIVTAGCFVGSGYFIGRLTPR